MRTLLLLSAAALLAACSGGKAPDPTAALVAAKAELCKCTDLACADKAGAAVTAWTDKHGAALGAREDVKQLLEGIELCRDNAKGDALAREILQTLTGYRDRACACASTDAACVEAVQNEQAKWLLDNQPRLVKVQSTKRQEDAANTIATETEKCVKAVVAAAEKAKKAAAQAPAPGTP